ncbi:MAG: carboxypeptidase-like regulatory domain-containing protein [Schleiferiaceae bacterium]|nr:carboxypeptidase-like regulatory domain-containing protein [Schleiferiaceae bacterium]
MKTALLVLPLVFVNLLFGQVKSVVVDSSSKEKIPFVNIWVEDQNRGTSANLYGEFELQIDTTCVLVFSAIGYETIRLKSDAVAEFVEMKRYITELDEVVVTSREKNIENSIGKANKAAINHFFGCRNMPWIIARMFPYESQQDSTPYLKEIRLVTRSEIKNASFNIRLYGINEAGEPEGYLYHQNIIAQAKKGKRVTTVDVSQLNIILPSNDFFVAFEWIITDANRHEYTYTTNGDRKKRKGLSYEPSIGAVSSETDSYTWIYLRGKWQKGWETTTMLKNREGNHSLLAIELLLVN